MPGDRNKILNRDLPHRFNVMDLFHVTNVWYERIGQKHGVKVRFEKLNLAEKSWWAANGSPLPVPIDQRDFETKPEAFKCETCFDESVRVYEAGWMCLNSTCKEFWKIDGAFPTSELTFNPSFLSFRTPPDPAIQPHCNLVPDLLSTLDEYGSDVSTSRTAWKGIVCPMCGKCIRRTFWRGWKCADDSSNKDGNGTLCEFERFMDMKPVPLEAVIGNSEQALTKRAAPFGLKLSDPLVDTTSFHPYQTFTHEIDGVGSITHFVANKTINTSLNGPDDLFRKLQGDDHGLKRLPLSTSLGN